MNVIVANKYKDMLYKLDIDVIKSIEGEYEAEEISNMFKNFFFQSMILDITSIKNYTNVDNLKKLSNGIDLNKIVLVLDNNEECSSPKFLSRLVSAGIYNFTRNSKGIKYLIEHPNTLENVKQFLTVDTSEFVNNKEPEIVELPEETPIDHFDIPIDGGIINEGMIGNSFGIDNSPETIEENENISVDDNNLMENDFSESGVKIIGIKNITDHAGATSLVYMMKTQLMEKYDVVGIEINKTDFTFFKDDKLITTTSANVNNTIKKNSSVDVILLDLNDYANLDICDDVLYLLEPSTLKLNKLMLKDSEIFKKMKNNKIILNKSLLEDKDVSEFEYEAKTKIFYNLPPIDDRELPNRKIQELINLIGFMR